MADSEDREESEDDIQTYTTPQTEVDPASGMGETTGGATSAQEPLSKRQRI